MKLGIMQPYFFPYIGYWQLLNAVDTYVIYDDVNFIKGGWINRNRILINKQPAFFNVQLKDPSPFKKINEIEISNDKRMKKKMLSTLQLNYKRAPYYDIVYPLLEKIILQNETNLSKYLIYLIKSIADFLDIDTNIIVSSEIEKNSELKAQDKVIEICRNLGATEYYNAIGGKELYNFADFKNNDIDLYFLKTNDIVYTQFKNDFVSNLSIIDVLMFNSKEEIKDMLLNFELINNKVKANVLCKK